MIMNQILVNMKKIITFMLAVCMGAAAIDAQEMTVDEIKAEIIKMQKCYDGWGIEYSSAESKINNKTVKYALKVDFKNANFLIADQNVEKELPLSIESIQKNYYNQKGTFHIIGHGLVNQDLTSNNTISVGGHNLTAQEVAKLITERTRYYEILLKAKEEPLIVVIHSCKAAMHIKGSFAEQLSAELAKLDACDILVVAAEDKVYTSNRNGRYDERIAPYEAMANRPDFKGSNWKVFKDGKYYMDGTPDFRGTVEKAQSELALKRLAEKFRNHPSNH